MLEEDYIKEIKFSLRETSKIKGKIINILYIHFFLIYLRSTIFQLIRVNLDVWLTRNTSLPYEK